MECRTITTDCCSLSNAIAETTLDLHKFVREVREARSEIDLISRELHSLDGLLDLLRDDASSLPATVARRIPALLQSCITIVEEIGGYISVISREELSVVDKKHRWVATRQHLDGLRSTLEALKSALGLGLDVVGLSRSGRQASGEADVSAKGVETDLPIQRLSNDVGADTETSRVMTELRHLTAALQGEFQGNGLAASLQGFLDSLQGLAESAGLPQSAPGDGDAPDSAIGMDDEPAAATLTPLTRLKMPTSRDFGPPIAQFDEFLDELQEMPSRPPTPPPKAVGRANSVRGSMVSPPPPPFARPMSSLERGHRNLATQPSFDGPVERLDRVSSLGSAAPAPPEFRDRPPAGLCAVVTTVSADSKSSIASSHAKGSGRVGRFFGHMRGVLSDPARDSPVSSPAAAADMGAPARGIPGGSLARSRSRRMSISFIRLPLRKTEDPRGEEAAEADAVFGVPLQKSINVARGTVKTHHGTGSSGSSRRDLPLCVLKSYSFIKEKGLHAPDIFGEGGDPDRIKKLKGMFSTAPAYGADVDWDKDWFSVHDAADLILIFLTQLPKPLVPESTAKRWISLSKQATLPGSHSMRLEQCIDFWEEALGGIRGPARSLLKLLLNLWGDIADAADANDMTAERLAARVLNPLMHLPPGRYNTDFMLGLAFLIRKRSEYSMLLQGSTRKSNAAF